MKRGIPLVALFAAVAVVACGSPPPAKEPQIVAEFDPSLVEPKLPLPNILAVDPDTKRLDVDDPAGANDAEKAFNAWLRTLDGFPVTSVASTTFSGEIDPSTVVPSNVQLFDVTFGAVTRLTPKKVTLEGAKLTVEYVWSAGHTYGIALLGGPTGLRGVNGEAVVGTTAFDLLRATYPMVTCSDLADASCRSANPAIRGKTIDEERRKALKMENARLKAAPIIEALEAGGFPRENLSGVWTFRTQGTVTSEPTVTFDPAVRAIPFPCDALLKDGRVALPEEPGDDVLVTRTKADLAKLDGFSTTASIVTEHENTMPAVGMGLLPGSLTASQFQLLDLDASNAAVPFTLSTKKDPDQILLHATKPLRSHRHYAVVWTKGAKAADARDLVPSPAWALMTAGQAFTDAQGKSRVRTLDDANAADLERLRQSVLAGLAAAEAKGVARSDVLLAWTFTTLTTAPTFAELRNKPAEWNLPTAVTGVAALPQASQLNLVTLYAMKDFDSQVRGGVEGTFTTGNALDLMGSELDLTDPANPVAVETEGPFTEATLASPRREQLKFMLVLPKVPKNADGRIPIIIFQHGINSFRRDALLIANTIARKGYATLAIDHPLHGDRSYCTSDADCAAGLSCAAHRCPVGGYRISTNFIDMQIGRPAISGYKFSSTSNLAATRDQIRQLIIDTAQLVRVVKDTTAGIGSVDVDDPATATVTERLDVTELGYIGMSLGSVMGSVAVAANPEITRATFNVGGASPADILILATVDFLAAKRRNLEAYLLASRGVTTTSQAYADFLDVARWMLDTADCQNFGRHYIDEPLPGYPKKRIFLSNVLGDPWVPNPTTALLSNAIERTTAPMNFGEHLWSDNGNHAFMLDPTSPIVLMAQDEAVSWIDAP